MAAKKKAKRKSSESVLVLAMLAAAVVLGVAIGSYLGTIGADNAKSASVDGTAGTSSTPRTEIANEHQEEGAPNANRHWQQRSVKSEHNSPLSHSQDARKSEKRSTPNPSAALVTQRPAGRQSSKAAQGNSANLVALTFDAGASSAPTPTLLDTLKSMGLRVTFFLTGKWCERNESLVQRIADEGHEIANHTYSHRDLRKLSNQEIQDELLKADEIVHRLTGRHCIPYFRPPYGSRDKRVIEAAREAGYTCVYWSLDSWDAVKQSISASEIKDRVLQRVEPGDIVLMHCGSWATVEALPGIIRELESRGFRIVPVSELITPQE